MSEPDATERAQRSLEALALGDAFGEMFFRLSRPIDEVVERRELPEGPWRYTDDTAMAIGICEVLQESSDIDADRLAEVFARHYRAEPWRGYGANARRVLEAIAGGRDWGDASTASFGGAGSYGNGAAMRVAPLGAYFAEDWDKVVDRAETSARITHAHPEGIAGAIAVAVATAVAWRTRPFDLEEAVDRLFAEVLDRTPSGETRDGIEQAAGLPLDEPVALAAERLGSGQRVTSMDTVPFVIWCAARHLDDLTEALWQTVTGKGDRDTTCAMVGGIVAQRAGLEDVPQVWFDRRESL